MPAESPTLYGFLIGFIRTYQLDEWAHVIELIITVAGFVATGIGLFFSKRAADAARQAAEGARSEVQQLRAVVGLHDVIVELEDVKRLIQQGAWTVLAGRCSKVRRNLIDVRHSYPDVSTDAKKVIQTAISLLQRFEENALNATGQETPTFDVAKMRSQVIRSIDQLHETLAAIRETPNARSHGRE